MANDMRSMLLDLEGTGQLCALSIEGHTVTKLGQLKRVGADYLVIEQRSWEDGMVIGMFAVPFARIEAVDLRPAIGRDLPAFVLGPDGGGEADYAAAQ